MKKHIKNYLSVAIIAILTLSFVVTYAEENGDENKPGFPRWSAEMKEGRDAFKAQTDGDKEAFRAELQKKRDAWKAEVSAKREEWKKANSETKEKFWNGAKRMLGERFTAAVRNLERAQARVQEVIDDAEADGADVDAAQDLLDDSKELLEDAKDKIEEIKALIPDSGQAVTPELFEQIKLKAREAKDLLKESHKTLIGSVLELKDILGIGDDNEEDGDDE